MKITIITPMQEEKEKILNAFREKEIVKNSYEIIVSGIGRENLAKAMLSSLTSDKFIKTSDIPAGTLINMEDYTFMYVLKAGTGFYNSGNFRFFISSAGDRFF